MEQKEILVEEYLVQEADLSEEGSVKWKELVEELKLPEQEKLLNKDVPFAYERLTPEENTVYKVLLPREVSLDQFGEFIPLRVLELIKHIGSDTNVQRADLKVWCYQEGDLLLLWRKSWGEYYKIARWGRELLDFISLKKIAKEKLMRIARGKYSEAIGNYQNALKNIETIVDAALEGERTILDEYNSFQILNR